MMLGKPNRVEAQFLGALDLAERFAVEVDEAAARIFGIAEVRPIAEFDLPHAQFPPVRPLP